MPRGNGGIIGPVNTSFSGVWSLTEAQLRRSANTWPNFYAALLSESATGTDVFSGADAADPYFEYTTLLLPGNGTNLKNNNEFLDSSSNAFTITRNPLTGPNAPTQGTFSPFSQTGWGNYFDGTGDSIYASSANTANAMGTGDWTIEASVYKTNSTEGYVFDTLALTGGSTDAIRIAISSSGAVYFYKYSTLITSGGSIALNTWNHIAVVRQSQTIKIYLNGTQVNTTYSDTGSNYTCGTNRPLVGINGYDIASDPFQGYISNLRAVKGVAVYTGNFTPPTSPLAATQSAGTNISAITGTQTSLLTCQSNRFIDNSSNNFTITRNGDTRVVAFSPFNPTAAWSAATNGGSGYFDGSGDYLTGASTSGELGAGDFTIEAWVYSVSKVTTQPCIFSNYSSFTTGSFSIFAGHSSSSTTKYQVAINGTFPAIQSTSDIVYNAWTHIAVVRNGSGSNNVTLYINGVANGTATSTATLNGTSGTCWVGASGDNISNTTINAYISGVRVVKGTAVYTSAFTPPTAPLTAITNTSLLLNFTNAGIYDATSKNDLETVGDAQVSTAINNAFGASTGVMKFDGNGDYLTAPSSILRQFGTANFTIEFWFYKAANGSYNYGDSTGDFLLRIGNTGFTTNSIVISTNNSQQITAFIGYSGSWATTIISSSTFSLNTWYYVALVRAGTGSNQTTLYVNGTSYGTGTSSTNLTDSSYGTSLRVGASSSDRYFNGYMQDLRITNGVARTVTTTPTAAFPTL